MKSIANYSAYETGYKKSLSSYLSSLYLVKMQNYPSLKLPQPPALPEALKKGEWHLTTSYGINMSSDTEKKLDPHFNTPHSSWSITFMFLSFTAILTKSIPRGETRSIFFMDEKYLKKYFGAVPFSVTC